MKRKVCFTIAKIICVLLFVGFYLLIVNWWRIDPYFKLQQVTLPAGSKIIERTNIRRGGGALQPRYYGTRTAVCPLERDEAITWIEEHNELDDSGICFLENGAMSSMREWAYPKPEEGKSIVILYWTDGSPLSLAGSWDAPVYIVDAVLLIVFLFVMSECVVAIEHMETRQMRNAQDKRAKARLKEPIR